MVNLPTKDVFSRAELIAALKEEHPDYQANDFSWLLGQLIKEKQIFHLGHDRYSRREPLVFAPREVEGLTTLRSLLLKQHYRLPFVVFSSTLLNEGLNELLAHDTWIVETLKGGMETLFAFLKERCPHQNVLFNPTGEDRLHYAKENTLVLFPLATRSPLYARDGKISLEKLIVDVFADRGLREFFSLDEVGGLSLTFLRHYSYDERVLLSYAKRRGVEAEVKAMIAASGCAAIKFKAE